MELNSSSNSVNHGEMEHQILHLSNGAIITLIVMVILTFISLLGLLGLYFLCPRRRLNVVLSRSAAAANLAHIHIHAAAAHRPKPGLEPHEINKLPLLTLQDLLSKSSKNRAGAGGGVGCCAVCLAEFSDDQPGDEKIRFLPRCSHCFHPHCVDVWLQTSASCPLCRCAVHQEPRREEEEEEENHRQDQDLTGREPADDSNPAIAQS
ncbi:RING-H2 finger protein ATL39-like [Selaginella moellendorffii]|uniref:RING-H2 finger protein ATL39-like n=1 Tax=Selaginella moellendorffii TaxID=88036 RepID=UPI000D1CDC04|nr:RING-H2 finger protein ATL39-like [Selaginella moellendorffii]|eukprot:XP_024532864.1 RING-H2 finger protein ATL39-like [Selaginella moellendorffii]